MVNDWTWLFLQTCQSGWNVDVECIRHVEQKASMLEAWSTKPCENVCDYSDCTKTHFRCCTHRVEVGEKAERGGSIKSEGQEVFEVELRLQWPSRDRERSEKGAALG